MVKHGGGYVIVDVRGKITDEGIVTDDVAAAINGAIAAGLPIMYIGPQTGGTNVFDLTTLICGYVVWAVDGTGDVHLFLPDSTGYYSENTGAVWKPNTKTLQPTGA